MIKEYWANCIANNQQINPFDDLDSKIQLLKSKGKYIIDFGVGDPAKIEGINPYLVNKFNLNYQDYANKGYPGNTGDKDFLISAQQYLAKEHNVVLDTENILITNGSKTAITLVPRIFLNDKDDVIICPNPCYPNFKTGAQLFNANIYMVPLLQENNFLIDFHSIPIDICNKAKYIWINYPNSPTGAIAPKDYLLDLIKWCHKYNIILLSDEAYIDIYFNQKQTSILELTQQGVLAFFSLSKSFNMTNHRIGFIAGDKSLINKFYKLSNMYNDGVPSIIQSMGKIALDASDKILPQSRQNYALKAQLLKKMFVDKFNCLEAVYSKGSIFLWQEVPKNIDDKQFSNILLNKGIAVMCGSDFVDDKYKHIGSKYIRVALIQNINTIKEIINEI